MKILLRTVVILLILFVMLYVGMNNNQLIHFNFPVFFAKGVEANAALIYFAVFAIGVIGGVMFHPGGGGGGGGKRSSSK